jgi:deoxyguanosine kinase
VSAIFVAIEGPTGVGKTTLAARLARVLDAEAALEPFEANPFLAPLLTSSQPTEAAALRAELTFFALRVAQLREIAELLTAGRSVVADWALLKQPIFAATTLGPADVALVDATLDVWVASLPSPDVLIGLSATMPTLHGRVRQRRQDIEAGLTAAQLGALSLAFDTAYAQWCRPLIRLDAANVGVFAERHLSELATQVRQLTNHAEKR